MADPNWSNGHYYGITFPVMGMQHARELGTISYRSGPEWESRFGNKRANPDKSPDFCPDFLIETYLERQVCCLCQCILDLMIFLREKSFAQVMILIHCCIFLR